MRVVGSDGRAKVYRPLDPEARRDAREAGLAAYAEGRFFEAHELLEPAWMGSADPAERDLDQGLIKLAAAYVHAERGNLLGMRKNLAGAQRRLGAVVHTHGAAGQHAGDAAGVDAKSLLARVEGILVQVEALLAAKGQAAAADPLPARFPPPAIPRATTRRRHVAREASSHA
jgi:hypothetical protein